MVWVKSELAEELAVVAAWLSALIPWSVSVALDISVGSVENISLVEIRFPFGLVRYLYGIAITGDAKIPNPLLKTPWGASEFYAGSPGSLPFDVWTVGAAVLGLAVLLSIGMYLFEEELAASPVDPVRLMGGLLLLSAVVLTISSYVLQFGTAPFASSRTFPGVLVPIGVVVQYAFAYVLLRVDRVDETDADDAVTPPNDPA